MATVVEIIERCGGEKKLCSRLKIKPKAIAKWRENGKVPRLRWPDVMTLGGVSFLELTNLEKSSKTGRK